MVGPIAPKPGPMLAKQESETDIPSTNVRLGSKYRVTNEPTKKSIMNMKKNTPTLRKRWSSSTFSPIRSFIIARG